VSFLTPVELCGSLVAPAAQQDALTRRATAPSCAASARQLCRVGDSRLYRPSRVPSTLEVACCWLVIPFLTAYFLPAPAATKRTRIVSLSLTAFGRAWCTPVSLFGRSAWCGAAGAELSACAVS